MTTKSLLLLCLMFSYCLSFANKVEVCINCKYKSIQSGVDAACDGDLLIVKEGLYKENSIHIFEGIHLKAEGEVVIDGEFKETILNFHTNGFTLEGFKIINVGQSYTKDFAAILVANSKDFTIKNNTLENVFFGIMIEKSKNGNIVDNTVSSNAVNEASAGNGIHIWHSSKMKVLNNDLFKLRDGIYFEFVTKSRISDNRSHDNIRYGLHFMFSNHDDYDNNVFSNNGAGVAVMFSKFINMTHNTFEDNWGSASYGLLLKEIYDAEIVSNKFAKNTTAVRAEGSTRINYKNNVFSSNGWALKISGACYLNIFTDNNFLNNSFDLSYNGQLNNNNFDHNYWSSYSGYDLDKDGVGDVPFRPVKLFSYIVNRTPETIVMLRSLFVDIINFSEKVSPVFTPDALQDLNPLMKPIQ